MDYEMSIELIDSKNMAADSRRLASVAASASKHISSMMAKMYYQKYHDPAIPERRYIILERTFTDRCVVTLRPELDRLQNPSADRLQECIRDAFIWIYKGLKDYASMEFNFDDVMALNADILDLFDDGTLMISLNDDSFEYVISERRSLRCRKQGKQ